MIPAWYPTKADPVAGSFFKEQAEALSKIFDFFVIAMKFVPFSLGLFVHNGFRLKIIEIDTELNKIPEINCTVQLFLIERILRFLLRHDCFKGSTFRKLSKLLESYFDNKRNIAYLKVYKYIQREFNFTPDLIYAMTAQTNGVEAFNLARNIGIPVVLAEHVPFPIPGTLVTERMKYVIENCDAILSVSNHLTRLILMQGIECSPIKIGNMIDQDIFTLRPIKENLNTPTNILFVGAYSFYKDYDTFFKSMSYLRTITEFDFRLTIVGYDVSKGYSAGEEKFQLHFKKYNLSDITTLVTKASRGEMVDFYHEADIFVSTSIQETFGVSCLEALSCGIPVYATKSGGVEDFIDDNCGRLFDVKDYKAIANSMKEFLEHKIIFNSDQIRTKIIDKYGVTAFCAMMSRIFNSVIEEQSSITEEV